MLAGYFLWFPSVKNLIFVLVSIFYLVVGSLLEEVKLTNQFGEDYRNYRRKVKMLIPGVL